MDEKIIKKNAVPVIAAMITALAFSFFEYQQCRDTHDLVLLCQ